MSSPETYDDRQAADYAAFAADSFSWKYIERPVFEEQLTAIVPARARLLDIGCGTGRVLRYLLDQGAVPDQLCGIDPSPSMLAHAQAVEPRSHLARATAEALPFDDNSFDFITGNMWLHNINTKQARAAIREIGRTLVPAGRFVSVDLNPRQYGSVSNWRQQVTPWGGKMLVFAHNYSKLQEEAEQVGLTTSAFYEPIIAPAGQVESREYTRYAQFPRRIAWVLKKSL
ncbi:MAG TPA: class I SAM-dependent methyltransferase [Candidatus Saccharimonadales bacterium]|nr:class I SAM-dependent methyltransferase [Candidatus Saccharimonadales bacterium]